MTTDMATALVVLAGVILTGIATIIVAQINGRRAERRERADEHTQNAQRLDTLAGQNADMAWRLWQVQQQLPPGGLSQWIETLQANTDTMRQHGVAMKQLADSLAALSKRVDAHDVTLRTLTGATPSK